MLEVKGLRITSLTRGGAVPLVRDLSFQLPEGGTLGLVGESGSGKTVTCMALMGLLSVRTIKIEAEKLTFAGRDLLRLSRQEKRSIRGREISMAFQDPMTSLNPLMRAGEQVAEAIRRHQGLGRGDARKVALSLLEQMGLPEPERRYQQYPFELSGGMRQRVLLAVALSCRPKLLIADEPTTALDVTLQAQIMELIKEQRRRHGMALLLVTHDLTLARDHVDELMVLYAGTMAEKGPISEVLSAPRHPYTFGLMQSLPPWHGRVKRLHAIEGVVPRPRDFVPGCRFHPRCFLADARCREEVPAVIESESRAQTCHHFDKVSPQTGGGI